MADAPATGGDGVDREHRRANADPGDLGLVRALVAARPARHVGRGAPHVEADHLREPEAARDGGAGDEPAGGTGEHRVAPAQAPPVAEPAVALHDPQPAARQLAQQSAHVTCDGWREVRVDDRRVRAREQPALRDDLVRERDLGEPRLEGEGASAQLVGRVAVGVGEDDRERLDPAVAERPELRAQRHLVERIDARSVRADAAVDLDHRLVQRLRSLDPEREDRRAGLIVDEEEVAEAARDQQRRPRAATLEQRVGAERRPHADVAGRDRRGVVEIEQASHAGERRTIGREDLRDAEHAGRPIVADAVGESPTAIDEDRVARRLVHEDVMQAHGLAASRTRPHARHGARGIVA